VATRAKWSRPTSGSIQAATLLIRAVTRRLPASSGCTSLSTRRSRFRPEPRGEARPVCRPVGGGRGKLLGPVPAHAVLVRVEQEGRRRNIKQSQPAAEQKRLDDRLPLSARGVVRVVAAYTGRFD